MDRRVKAGLIALFSAWMLVMSAQIASADDDWLLRALCAPWAKYSQEWWFFGCWMLPDPPPPMTD